MELEELLLQVLGSGTMGVAGFYLVNILIVPIREKLQPVFEAYPWMKSLEVFMLRALAYIITGVLSFVPFSIAVYLECLPKAPEPTFKGWVTAATPYIIIAILAGQGIHAIDKGAIEAQKIRARRIAEAEALEN